MAVQSRDGRALCLSLLFQLSAVLVGRLATTQPAPSPVPSPAGTIATIKAAGFLPLQNLQSLNGTVCTSPDYFGNYPILQAGTYLGESSDYLTDTAVIKYQLWIENLRPAFEVAIADAWTQYKVQINVDWYAYMPCVSKVAWYSLNLMTQASRNPSQMRSQNPTLPPTDPGNAILTDGIQYDMFIGPPCATDALQAGIVTTIYPAIYLTGSVTLADTLAEYKNAVRCNWSSYTQWSLFLSMAAQYKWSNMALFYDDTDATRTTWANSLMTRWAAAQYTFVQFALSVKTADITSLLTAAQLQARVFVILSPSMLRSFMLAASAANMTQDGSYIYFQMDQFPNNKGSFTPATDTPKYVNLAYWKQSILVPATNNDTTNAIALAAYRSLYVFVVQDVSLAPAAVAFQAAALSKTADLVGKGKIAKAAIFAQNYFTRTSYDCLMAVARGVSWAVAKKTATNYTNLAVNPLVAPLLPVVAAGENPVNSNRQKLLSDVIGNFIAGTVLNGASGTMTLKSNRDREEDFMLFAMTDIIGGQYSQIATYFGSNGSYIEGPNMVWPNNKSAPPNKPDCGYDGLSGPCVTVFPLIPVVAGCASGIALILFVVGFFYYRRLKRLAANDKMWIAKWHDLEVLRPGGPLFSAKDDDTESETEAEKTKREDEEAKNEKTVDGIHNEEGNTVIHESKKGDAASHKTQAVKITPNTGLWKKQAVTVRWSKKRRLTLTKAILKQAREVKSLTHENLMAFRGACLEDDRILIIYENCSKGSLTELIADPNTKLEWAMRFSLMQDCMKATSYLHKSVLHVHGRLTSSCCYIDSRFMLKVGDYGLNAFFELTLAELWAAKREPDYLTAQLWKAPEHLRAEALSRYEVINSVSQKGDVYSYGIIMQELVMRSKPFSMYALSEEEIIDLIKQSANESNPRFIPKIDSASCPAELIDLCDRCWSIDPNKRPNMVQIRAYMKELGKQLGMGERSNILDTLLQQMEDMENNLQAIIEEKGQVLLDQKNQSDQLLYSVLPREVAEVMKKGEKAGSENYEQVTLMHVDIPQFSDLAVESTALQMVELLNGLSDVYDSVIEQYDAYKIDSYKETTLVVSGLPHRNAALHAQEICRVALTLIYTIRKFKIKQRADMKLGVRIGIHTGPLMAGVVGENIPRYLLFGDTVNVSAQMLTGGEVMKAQLSLMTKLCLDKTGFFELEERGEVFVKGKGAMKTYWLLREFDNYQLDELRIKYENGEEDEPAGSAAEEEDNTIPAEPVPVPVAAGNGGGISSFDSEFHRLS